MKNIPKTETVWQLFRCERGKQWSTVKGGICDDTRGGQVCYASGCQQDHKVEYCGETMQGTVAHYWFRFNDCEAIEVLVSLAETAGNMLAAFQEYRPGAGYAVQQDINRAVRAIESARLKS